MVAVNRFRSDLNIFKQCIHQQNLEIVMFTNDIKSKYKTQHSYINNLVQVYLIFIKTHMKFMYMLLIIIFIKLILVYSRK